MVDLSVIWDDEDDPDGNVQHIAGHDLTMDEVEDVLLDDENPVDEPIVPPSDHVRLDVDRPTYRGRLGGRQRRPPAGDGPDGLRVQAETETIMERPKRIFRKVERTPEELAELRAEREYFARERPNHDDLMATGDYDGPYRQGDVFDLLSTIARLRDLRRARNLSLADIAAKSGIHKPALSLLESGRNPNPTVDTLRRYAMAVGARIAMEVREVEAV